MYRILTEDKNRAQIEKIMSDYFPKGFTIIPATGYWNGQREQSLAIEIETPSLIQVRNAAYSIKYWNEQQSVLIQHIQTDAEFV